MPDCAALSAPLSERGAIMRLDDPINQQPAGWAGHTVILDQPLARRLEGSEQSEVCTDHGEGFLDNAAR